MYPLLFSLAMTLGGVQDVQISEPPKVVAEIFVTRPKPTTTTTTRPKPVPTTTTTTAPVTGFRKALSAVGKPASFIGSDGQFWCADLITWITGVVVDGPLEVWHTFPRTEVPEQGDAVLIDLLWDSGMVGYDPTHPTHVAVVEKIEGDVVYVIEGNGASTTHVVRSTWPMSAVIGFVDLGGK